MMCAVKICLRVIIVAFFAVQCGTVGAMKRKMPDSDLPLKKRKIKQPLVEDQKTLLTVSEPVDETEEESFDGDFVSDEESEYSSSDDDSSYEPENEPVVNNVSYQGTCSVCSLTFDDPSLFYLHLKAKHIHQIKKRMKKKMALYYCDLCNIYIANICNHLYIHHVKFRRFVCPWCKKGFYQSGGLSAHKKCCVKQ